MFFKFFENQDEVDYLRNSTAEKIVADHHGMPNMVVGAVHDIMWTDESKAAQIIADGFRVMGVNCIALGVINVLGEMAFRYSDNAKEAQTKFMSFVMNALAPVKNK